MELWTREPQMYNIKLLIIIRLLTSYIICLQNMADIFEKYLQIRGIWRNPQMFWTVNWQSWGSCPVFHHVPPGINHLFPQRKAQERGSQVFRFQATISISTQRRKHFFLAKKHKCLSRILVNKSSHSSQNPHLERGGGCKKKENYLGFH